MNKRFLLKIMSFWPPYLGAGIRVKNIASDYTSVDVEMKLRFWNQNYVGTHFGGSLYAMTDPFFMLILLENLGRDYIVWDKASSIQFKKPGKGTVRAHFEISKDQIEIIRKSADENDKVEPVFLVSVLDHSNQTIATVEKTLYVRKKTRK